MRVYWFGDYELDTGRKVLVHSGRTVELEPKQYGVLLFLVENARRVSVRELVDAVWDGPAQPSCVHQAVSGLRRAMRSPESISGSRMGYQLYAKVSIATRPSRSAAVPRRDDRAAWRYYAAHGAGSAAERAQLADELVAAEGARFGS